jgi:hypothetical protein
MMTNPIIQVERDLARLKESLEKFRIKVCEMPPEKPEGDIPWLPPDKRHSMLNRIDAILNEINNADV